MIASPFGEFAGGTWINRGFFEIDERLALSGHVDQLEALSYSDGSKGGRPPSDEVILFKILVLQMIDTLSDDLAVPGR